MKSSLKGLKTKLWGLCRDLTRKHYSNTCFTCYKHGLEGSNLHTGHFIPSSICSAELRYDLDNLRPQCYACNIHKSGNWPAFEQHLIQEKGVAFVNELKAKNQRTKGLKYDTLWYVNKIEEYKKML